MGGPFAAGKHAFGFCDRCGFRYPLGDLRAEVVNLEQTGIKACPECWNPDQPQNQLGRKPMVDAQALRSPRPTGAIAGRDLEAAYRWDFSTGTALTNPTRIDAWWAHYGAITWDSVNKTLNLVSDGTVSPGDPHLVIGWNNDTSPSVPLSIDTSIYKFVTTVFKVNRFPDFEPDDRYQYDFQGDLFWSTNPTLPSWPFNTPGSSGLQKASNLPVLTNIQASDGFLTADRKMSPWFKLVWDMTDDPDWTGTVTALRLDYFDARNEPGEGPDYDAGDIDIDYIAVEAFHNFNLEPDPIGPW